MVLREKGDPERSHKSYRTTTRAVVVAILIGLFGTLSLMTASPASAATTSTTTPVKAAPVVPNAARNAISPPVNKQIHALSVSPLIAWTTSLSASPNNLWPTQYSTLTATANQNVGPTPYYLSIYDLTAHAYKAICGTGTTCSVAMTQTVATTHSFVSLVSYYPSTYPATGVQATSPTIYVVWHSVSVSLSASPSTTYVGGAATLTATTSYDVGPSPFYTEIFDATTGGRLAVCGFGTSCSASTSQWIATTHRFIAYVSYNSTALPPSGIQGTSRSAFVTWTFTSYRISLSAPSFTFGTSATATATVNQDVGPTPYWIEIFNQNGTRLAVCGSGTTCSATFSPAIGGTNLVAFVSSYSTAYLPPNIQASSNVTTTSRFLIILPTPRPLPVVTR